MSSLSTFINISAICSIFQGIARITGAIVTAMNIRANLIAFRCLVYTFIKIWGEKFEGIVVISCEEEIEKLS